METGFTAWVTSQFGASRCVASGRGLVAEPAQHVRFSWELGPEGATDAPIAGSDVAVLAADGKLRDVHGFLDRVPG